MKKNGSHLVWNQDFTFHLRRLKHADVRRDYNRPLVKLELYRTRLTPHRDKTEQKRRVYAFIYRMIRDKPLGWTEIPLNRIQYGSDYAQGSEKWHHLSTLRRTGEEMFCYVCFSNCLGASYRLHLQ